MVWNTGKILSALCGNYWAITATDNKQKDHLKNDLYWCNSAMKRINFSIFMLTHCTILWQYHMLFIWKWRIKAAIIYNNNITSQLDVCTEKKNSEFKILITFISRDITSEIKQVLITILLLLLINLYNIQWRFSAQAA